MAIKIAFFCGHESRYGLAHLEPLIDKFDVRVVVIGTYERWEIFRQMLGGKVYYEPRDYVLSKSLAKNILPAWAIKLLRGDFRKINSIRRMLQSKNIPLWEIFDVNHEDSIETFKELDVELFVSAAYPQIFSKAILNIPNKGAVNFHPSLLPKYRGAHPHFWQIVNGEKEGGITAHFMTENVDDGDIIAQLPFPIDDCTYSELYEMIIQYTDPMVNDVRTFFETQTSQAKAQDSEDATYFRNNREIHSRIFWNIHTSREIYNLVRSGSAFAIFRGSKVVFTSSYATISNRNLTNGVRVENGTIVDIGKDSISVKTVDGCINFKEMKTGRNTMSFLQFARRKNIHAGERFE